MAEGDAAGGGVCEGERGTDSGRTENSSGQLAEKETEEEARSSWAGKEERLLVFRRADGSVFSERKVCRERRTENSQGRRRRGGSDPGGSSYITIPMTSDKGRALRISEVIYGAGSTGQAEYAVSTDVSGGPSGSTLTL